MRATTLATAIALVTSPAAAETAGQFLRRDNVDLIKDVGGNAHKGDAMLVGTLDNGANRDGLAGSFCMTVAKFPDAPTVIRIMDAAAASRGEWKLLGQAKCGEPGDETVIEFPVE